MSTSGASRRHPNVINLSEVTPLETSKGTRFGATIRQLGAGTGSQLVGCNWFEVSPGRAAFPRHFHCATEEVLYVLDGQGTLQVGEQRVEVSAGDFITFPPGPEHAHRLDNTGTAPLRYLCLSNKVHADVVGYPDSNKYAAMGSPGVNFFDKPWVRAVFRTDSPIDYYDGEATD